MDAVGLEPTTYSSLRLDFYHLNYAPLNVYIILWEGEDSNPASPISFGLTNFTTASPFGHYLVSTKRYAPLEKYVLRVSLESILL